jgi:peptidoglycan/LPS O-acetylase OafA/YrhL
VITVHLSSEVWRPLYGEQGVTIFFVLSGFVITTLLLREHAAHGRIFLRAFYVRRAFRVVPLYALVLAVYVVLVLGLGIESDKRDGLVHALPYYLTFTNEVVLFGDAFRNQIPFYQSWSLGVEEKFYLVWPVVGFLLLRAGGRLAAAGIALLGTCVVHVVVGPDWTAWYEPVLAGCVLALVLDDPRGFARLAGLGRRGWAVVAVAALAATHVLLNQDEPLGELVYPFVVAAVVVGLVTGASPVRRVLGSRVAAHVGRRAYGIYLVHILVINVVDRVVAPQERLSASTLVNAAGVVLGSYLVADALHRTVERPLIGVGRRVSARLREPARAG